MSKHGLAQPRGIRAEIQGLSPRIGCRSTKVSRLRSTPHQRGARPLLDTASQQVMIMQVVTQYGRRRPQLNGPLHIGMRNRHTITPVEDRVQQHIVITCLLRPLDLL